MSTEKPALIFEPLRVDLSFIASVPAPRPLTEEERQQKAAQIWENNPDSPEFKVAEAARLEASKKFMKEAGKRWAKAQKERAKIFRQMARRFNLNARVKVRVTSRAHGSKNRSSRSTRAPALADDGPAPPDSDPLTVSLPPADSLRWKREAVRR
jgi:hypothetical protein